MKRQNQDDERSLLACEFAARLQVAQFQFGGETQYETPYRSLLAATFCTQPAYDRTRRFGVLATRS